MYTYTDLIVRWDVEKCIWHLKKKTRIISKHEMESWTINFKNTLCIFLMTEMVAGSGSRNQKNILITYLCLPFRNTIRLCIYHIMVTHFYLDIMNKNEQHTTHYYSYYYYLLSATLQDYYNIILVMFWIHLHVSRVLLLGNYSTHAFTVFVLLHTLICLL